MAQGIPPKPSKFEPPVAWLLGRQLIANLKYIALYAAFKGKLDPRDWMKTKVYSLSDEPLLPGIETERIKPPQQGPDEFWFDYLADTGDGQKAVYSIAYLVMSNLVIDGPAGWEDFPALEVKELLEKTDKIKVSFAQPVDLNEPPKNGSRLPRGAFLFIGGDTSYHISDYATLADRFQNPFGWASRDLGLDEFDRRPLFGIPGNHDYYDSLDGFNRQFRRPATGEDVKNQRAPLLQLPTFQRCQEASYLALQLPFGWWFWGFDTENGDMDFRQRKFFKDLKEIADPQKLILATSQPLTVFGKYADPEGSLAKEFADLPLERPFLAGADKLDEKKCRLDLAGDVHHYVRYWGPNSSNHADPKLSANNYAAVVSGLGGAFLHPSQTDMDQVEEQVLFPSKTDSSVAVAREILDFWNLMTGGYVWLIGMILAVVVYFGATVPVSSAQSVNCISLLNRLGITTCKAFQATVPTAEAASHVYYWGPGAAPKPDGYWYWVAALLIAIVSIFALAIYSKIRFDKDEKERRTREETQRSDDPKPAQSLFRVAISERFWPIWILMVVSVLSLAWGMYNFAFTIPLVNIDPFGNSMLVLVSLVWAAGAIAESFIYSEWLFQQAYDRPVKWYDYWPIWVLSALAAGAVAFALWYFGQNNRAAYLVSDIIFALAIGLVVIGLILLAVLVGAGLHKWKGKALFGLLGLWHALLQILVPFLLVKRGTWLSFILVLASIFVFRWFGSFLVRAHSRLLALLWVFYGMWLLALPVIPPLISKDLPWIPQNKWPLLGVLVSGVVGVFMTCVTLGWYFAVSLTYHGHNSEAGGAARIEEFKEFMRIRINKEGLTAYVIGFEHPETDGTLLKPKIIDMFHLR